MVQSQYVFFSLAGYSDWVKENADPETVRQLTLGELYS